MSSLAPALPSSVTLTRPPTSPWTQLQTELRDLAFLLDRQGSHTAADVAAMISARIDELMAETPGSTGSAARQ